RARDRHVLEAEERDDATEAGTDRVDRAGQLDQAAASLGVDLAGEAVRTRARRDDRAVDDDVAVGVGDQGGAAAEPAAARPAGVDRAVDGDVGVGLDRDVGAVAAEVEVAARRGEDVAGNHDDAIVRRHVDLVAAAAGGAPQVHDPSGDDARVAVALDR